MGPSGDCEAALLMPGDSVNPGPKEARLATLFREDAALDELENWLKDMTTGIALAQRWRPASGELLRSSLPSPPGCCPRVWSRSR